MWIQIALNPCYQLMQFKQEISEISQGGSIFTSKKMRILLMD